MLWIGLFLAVCYVPGLTGASIPTQGIVLSCALPFGLWRQGPFTPFHILGLGFLAFALASGLWSTNHFTFVEGYWYLLLIALAFWLGSTLESLRSLWQGLAIGLTVSSGVAVAQALDCAPVEAIHDQYPGLFYNSTVLGALIALVLIACVSHRLWWYIPALIPGLILAGSRGSFVVLGLTAIARYLHWSVALVVLVLAAVGFIYVLDPADSQRLQIWGVALHGISLLGYAAGSFNDIYYLTLNHEGARLMIHPEYVHNDYLQLWFEYGIGALAIYTIYAFALAQRHALNWPVFFAFAILGLFYFPLYCPLPAFIGSIVAGHLLRRYDPLWALGFRWGPNLISRCDTPRPSLDLVRSEAIPMGPQPTHSEA